MSICDVGTIEIEQAIFASSDRGRMKGYQLVSQSSGIDRDSSQILCRWAPTQLRSSDPDKWTINCFPVSNEWFAVTRTVLGGPEYSGRGASQVVTLILLLRDPQFAAYSYNAMAVAKTALAMGYLRLPWDVHYGPIGQVTLPSRPIVEASLLAERQAQRPGHQKLLEELVKLISESRRIAVIGLENPNEVVDQLIAQLAVDRRREFSFTTGLTPAGGRPFQVHFLDAAESPLQRTLDSQNIVRLNAVP